jgi:hypothetical protein
MNGLILAALITLNTTMTIIDENLGDLSEADVAAFLVECKARGLTTTEIFSRDDKVYHAKCWNHENMKLPS